MLSNEAVIWEGHPTWRATLSFHIKGLLLTVALFSLLLLVDWAGVNMSAALPVTVLLVGVGLTVAAGWVQRYFTLYAITTKRLHIRQGILSKTESSTNVDRIQNITVYQSLVDRIMRVGSIDFDTASNDPKDAFRFAGVNDPQSLRERIMHARDSEHSSGPDDAQGGLA